MMGTRFWGGFAFFVLLGRFASVGEASGGPLLCARVLAVDAILPPPADSCSAFGTPLAGGGVFQGDEATLQKALDFVYRNPEEYVAMLFHASWCSFSKICRPNFNIMSSLFPTIRHFAFEESVIRPSILSRYGVHGFPTLFLLNSSLHVRYIGSRNISALVEYYSVVTGMKPVSLGSLSAEKVADVSSLPELAETTEQENCPFSWARSPEKLLQQDTYLALASSFLLLRLLYFLTPKLKACAKRARRRHIQYTSLMSFWDNFHAYLQQAKQGLNRLNPCKRSNHLQEGTMNAKSWASKSLASVSIGDPVGSPRAQTS